MNQNYSPNKFLDKTLIFSGKVVSFLWRKKFKIIVMGMIFSIGFVSFLFGGAYVTWMEQKKEVAKNITEYKNKINRFKDGIRPDPIKILDKKGVLIGEFFLNPFEPVRSDNLNNYKMFTWAVLSMEDRDFYEHSGINWSAVGRAVIVNLKNFRFSQGGSTISQQLAKLTMKLGERNIFNKITEIYATYYIESELTKDEILAIYMNKIFLGQGNNGVESSSRYYFDKPGEELSPAEAAMIVGSIPAPSVYNPVNNLRIALSRQKTVLMSMARNPNTDHRHPSVKDIAKFEKSIDKLITDFRKTYKIQEIKEEGKKTRYDSLIAEKGYDRNFKLNLAPDFNSEIRDYIETNYHPSDLEERSITVHTTLDYEKQKVAEASLKQGIEDIRTNIEALAKSSPKSKKKPVDSKIVKEISSGMRASFVGLEPNTGDVELFINSLRISSSYRPNRIETSFRQPGSTIKALIYAMIFEKRKYNQSSIVRDEKIDFGGYSPKNWYAGFKGDVTVRRSLAQSMNTIPVKFLDEIGVDALRDKLMMILDLSEEEAQKRFPRNLSLALGSAELTPMELAVIYATLQNGGKKITPRKVLKITDSNAVDEFSFYEPPTYQIMDPVACAMALDLLQAVLTSEGTMPIKIPQEERFPMGGKTGTVQSPQEARKRWGDVQGVRDAWFAGMIPNLTSVVWIGNEWGAPFPGSGSGTTGRVWWRFANTYSKEVPLVGTRLLSDQITGNFLQLDICTDDGTQLELDWEKEKLEIKKPVSMENHSDPNSENDPYPTDNPNVDINPTPGDNLSLKPRNPKSNETGVDPTTSQIKDTITIPNPRYCKLPAFAQYYYIGDSAPRRSIPSEITYEMVANNQFNPEDLRSRQGESEINKMDTRDTEKENPGLTESSSNPPEDPSVELELPSTSYDEPSAWEDSDSINPYSDDPFTNR